MSVKTNSTVQACHQKALRRKTMARRVSTIILNVYQCTGTEKEDDSRQSLENHGKLRTTRNSEKGMMCIVIWTRLRITRDPAIGENTNMYLE